jgi:hypothetical protein
LFSYNYLNNPNLPEPFEPGFNTNTTDGGWAYNFGAQQHFGSKLAASPNIQHAMTFGVPNYPVDPATGLATGAVHSSFDDLGEQLAYAYAAGAAGRILGTGVRLIQAANAVKRVSVMADLSKRFPGFEPLVTRIGGSASKSEIYPALQKIAKGDWIKVYQGGHINSKATEIHFYLHKATGQIANPKIKYSRQVQKVLEDLGY